MVWSKLSGLEMVSNTVCTLKIDGKHDLLTIFSARGQKQKAAKPLTLRAWSCWQCFLTNLSDVVKVRWRHKPVICHQTSSLLLACPFYSLKTKIFFKKWKSPVAKIRKMLLMKDRSFLYELRAYLIYVKVGEKNLFFYPQMFYISVHLN